jgi:hypothetical protein
MKQGPFARPGYVVPAVLATTAPSDSLSATRHFPLPVIDGLTPTPAGRGRGGPLQFLCQPSRRSTPPTPEGPSTPAPRSQVPSVAFAVAGSGSAPSGSRLRGQNNDAAGFASRCGPPSCLHLASLPASRPTPEASLPGTLASPRTGLTPAGCHKLALGSPHVIKAFLSTTGARATGRTPGLFVSLWTSRRSP